MKLLRLLCFTTLAATTQVVVAETSLEIPEKGVWASIILKVPEDRRDWWFHTAETPRGSVSLTPHRARNPSVDSVAPPTIKIGSKSLEFDNHPVSEKELSSRIKEYTALARAVDSVAFLQFKIDPTVNLKRVRLALKLAVAHKVDLIAFSGEQDGPEQPPARLDLKSDGG